MARDLMTIRLDSTMRARLRTAARRRALTPSAAVRLAVDAWLVAEDARSGTRPYEELADLLGCVEGPRGDPSLAARGRTLARARRGQRGGVL
jgi:hypothetical protein